MPKPTNIVQRKEELFLEILETLRRYSDPGNWGYYDDSGCPKGHSKYTDSCFVGPDEAKRVIKEWDEFVN